MIEGRSLATALLSDAAQILGPMAGAYTGYKLAHQDETKVEASPQEQPPQQPSP